MTSSEETAIERGPEEVFAIESSDLNRFRELVSSMERAGVKVQLVLAPYPSCYTTRIKNLPEWISRIEQSTDRKILDFSGAVLRREFFADQVHLNQDGQKTFTRLLLNALGETAASEASGGVNHLVLP